MIVRAALDGNSAITAITPKWMNVYGRKRDRGRGRNDDSNEREREGEERRGNKVNSMEFVIE